MGYMAASLLTKRIDHEGRTTTPIGVVYDASKVESYTYYPNGQMKSKTDRNGNTTTYTYDVHQRVTAQTVEGTALSKIPLAERQITYTYDGNGNQLTITDATGTTGRSYDELGRVVSKSVPQLGTSTFRYEITTGLPSGYTSEITKDVKGNVTTKVFDKTNRLTEVRSNNDQPIVYSYYADGSRKQVEYAGGVKETYTYTGNNQLQELKNWKGTTLLDTYTYTYDAAGNQLTKNEIVGGTTKGKTTYAYDALNRLQQVQEPGGKVTSYRFDAGGNRTEEKVTAGSVVTIVSYEYNEQNRLMKTIDAKTSGETQNDQYRYDGNGNMIHKSREVTKLFNPLAPAEPTFGMFIEGQPNENPRINDIVSGTVSFEYDVWNQLVKTSNGNGTSTYAYNGEGYRTKKTVNGQTTLYVYEYDKVVLETDGAGKQLARNVYGLNLLTREVGTEKYSYLYNGHSDVTALLDTAGVIKATYAYDAFGNITESTGTVQNPIRYAGYQYDEESSLYYLNARYYDPKIARFLSEDTYRGSDFDPLSLNYYTYTHNEPIMYIDPSGHEDVQLRQLAGAAGATITYDQKTKVATVTLVDGYSVKFSTDIKDENNKKVVTIKDGRMIIDNETFDQMMTGSQKVAGTNKTIVASVDSAVAGSNVAVVTYAAQVNTVLPFSTSGIQSKPTQAHEAKSVTVLRNTTIVFNKDTDKIISTTPVAFLPDFMKTENSGIESKAIIALTWVALADGIISKTERKELGLPKGIAVLELAYKGYQNGMSFETLNMMYDQEYGVKFGEIVGLGALRVKGTVSAPIRIVNRSCNCFTAGTKVLTDEGEKNIEDIEVGDRVLAKDENDPDGELAYKEVTNLYRNQRDDIIKLHVGEQVIETTDNHPFWVEGKGWVFADELQVGDKLQKADGNNLTIDKVEFVKLDEPVTVYNFTVADYHTYYVTDIGIWVHNTNCYIDLTGHRKDHILNRHRAGAGKPDKTEFPASWSDERILHEISDVATDPNSIRGMGKWDSPYVIGVRDGIEIRVDFYPNNHKYAGQISTAYPINVPANPPR
jgi:RHS repeat-associated protein